MRPILLALAVLALFSGCSIVDHSRMRDSGDTTPWNSRAEWEDEAVISS